MNFLLLARLALGPLSFQLLSELFAGSGRVFLVTTPNPNSNSVQYFYFETIFENCFHPEKAGEKNQIMVPYCFVLFGIRISSLFFCMFTQGISERVFVLRFAKLNMQVQ